MWPPRHDLGTHANGEGVDDEIIAAYEQAGLIPPTADELESFQGVCEAFVDEDPTYMENFIQRPEDERDTILVNLGPLCPDAVDGMDEVVARWLDADGDGVANEEDFRPKNPDIQTERQWDSDGDGVPNTKDAFPNNARFSKDSDGDRVPDSQDDYPNDPTRSEKPTTTLAQENALRSARQYLDYTAFSRTGLIEQLEYEQFSNADATWAVDQLKVDWNEQAFFSGQQYLDYTAFSRQGLIDQLIYEGFTPEQASYAVDKIGL